jgi:hypothetical protein
MKPEMNNEMDLLLRRFGRQQDAGASGNHLDADELSSYAENVLPAGARARYTEHLVECARCRDLVVQLSSAAGVVAAAETSRAPEPSGLRKFLASLFSPMVLRYAAPALGLIVVAVIGVVVLRRQNRPAESVAQLREHSPTFSITQPQSTPSTQSNNGVVNKVESPAATAPQQRETSKETSQPAPVPSAPPTVSSVSAENQQPANEKKPQEELAKEPPPAPKAAAPAATPIDEVRAKIDEAAQKREMESRTQVVNDARSGNDFERGRGEDQKSAGVATRREPTKNKDGSLRVAQPSAVAGTEGRRDVQQEKDKDDADVRSVAGRRFHKERGIWIDTAYDSSQSTTNVTRGSEQYRSLIGDEPQIKTIADQLDGEIIVVWKGRAYRIR